MDDDGNVTSLKAARDGVADALGLASDNDARVSWRSPLARALLTAKVGDTVTVRAPGGPERLEIVAVRYDELR